MSKGESTLDLIVMEFWSEYEWMDLASACVLRPLNRLVLDFEVGGRRSDERAEVWGYTGPEMVERIGSEGRS